jgi:NAD(P)-dependent dehydrogenase (short-subunit alcohol dehydrogenase family)
MREKVLEGKVAVVTGGSTGIGLATARRFVAEGASVFITGRRQKELDLAVADIGGDVTAVPADSARLADLDALYAAVKEKHGKLDVVVANAGILQRAPLGQITEEMVDQLFAINVKGLIFTVQKALPLLADGSSIVLMASTVAHKGLPGTSVYAATKAAIRSLARGWSADLAARKIRVNVISPGAIDTPGVRGPGGEADEASVARRNAFLAGATPLGRVGQPDEIAQAALYLASDAASFVNGANFEVDGGWAQI